MCVGKSFCVSPPSSFLSGHAVVQFQSATLFLLEECKIMRRTCESIARLKIEHKQPTNTSRSSIFWETHKYQRFLRSSRQKIGSKSAKNAVIYRGLAPSRAKNCVNTSVSASKSCQNTAIYSVSCLPHFLEIAKTV